MSLFGQGDKSIENVTKNTVNSVDIPQQFQALMDSIISQSMGAAGQPFQGDRIAGLSGDELSAFEQIRNLPGMGALGDLTGVGQDAILQGLGGLSRAPTSADIQPFMNPYTDLVLGDAQERLGESLSTALRDVSRRGSLAAGTSGRLGIRGDIARGIAVDDYLQSSRELQHRGLSDAFNSALGLYEGRQRDLIGGGIGARTSDLATAQGMNQLGLGKAMAQSGAGETQRGLEQALLDFQYGEPFQRASFLSGIAQAFPTDLFTRREKMNQTTESYTQQNPLNAAMGGLSSLGNIAFPGLGGGIGGLAQGTGLSSLLNKGLGGIFGGGGQAAGKGFSGGGLVRGYSKGGLVKRYADGGQVNEDALNTIRGQMLRDYVMEQQNKGKNPADTAREKALGNTLRGIIGAPGDIVEGVRGMVEPIVDPAAKWLGHNIGLGMERGLGINMPGISDMEAFPGLYDLTPAPVPSESEWKKAKNSLRALAEADPQEEAVKVAKAAENVRRPPQKSAESTPSSGGGSTKKEQHILDRLLGELEEESKQRGSLTQRNADFSRALGDELASGRAPSTNLARATTAYLPEKAPSKQEVMGTAIEATKAKAYEDQVQGTLAQAKSGSAGKLRELLMKAKLDEKKQAIDTIAKIFGTMYETQGVYGDPDPSSTMEAAMNAYLMMSGEKPTQQSGVPSNIVRHTNKQGKL
jgi:hypothetical protein